ncbi:MAG: L-seryl-tRNA(Sec) selenium transferase [Pyrinomonadaceae bacterium]
MPEASSASSESNLRSLPSVDEVLRTTIVSELVKVSGEAQATLLTRISLDELRRALMADPERKVTKREALDICERRLADIWQEESQSGIRRVVNATGVVIHTNLGRASLSEKARRAVAEASSYCTLEYNVAEGKRGRRGERVERMLTELTGAEDALVVNNCAAAALFILTVFAKGGEVITSRGEMVEIGGDFRVPDVLTQSGAQLREVGTTNRTKLTDYESAVNEKTRLILRVHPSNYRIVGFTAAPSLAELSDLAHRKNIFIYEDIGSGALTDLDAVGLVDEPVVGRSIDAGVDVVTFSGDKLLGGPQAGIIAGRREMVATLRKHPLYRALRVDKLTYAALEATLESHRSGKAFDEIPVLRMLSHTPEELGLRAQSFLERAGKLKNGLELSTLMGKSAVGGGAAPGVELMTTLIAINHATLSAAQIEMRLRRSNPAVIARIVNDRVMLDLRTVGEGEEADLIKALNEFSAN